MRRQHDDAHKRVFALDHLRRFDAIKTVEYDVHKHHIRLLSTDLFDDFVSVAFFAYDLNVGIINEGISQSLASQLMVFCYVYGYASQE